jgi:hypothetical protein
VKVRTLFYSTVIAVSAFVAVVGFTPVGAVESGGVGGRPANPDPSNARTKSIFIYELAGGQSKTDAVLLMNNTDRQETINVYAVDGILTNTGAYSCEQAAEQKDGVGKWVSFPESQVILPPKTNLELPFTTTVPEGVDVGEQNGCIVFQSATDEGDVQGNVRVRTRQAIRLAVTVPGDLKKEVVVKDFTVGTLNGLQQFLLTISNTGNVSADVDARITLRTLWGGRTYADGGGYPVLAQNDLQLNFINEKWPFWGGWYNASAEVTYDTRAGVFSVDQSGKLKTLRSDTVTVFIMPNAMALLIYAIVLLGIAGLVTFLVGRARERREVEQWVSYTIAEGDSVTSLAAHYGINWHVIVRANALKAPYTLVKGDEINLPKEPKQTQPSEQKKRRAIKKG